ncbi:U3 snoRNA associated-domain-containing protein [Scheffersomyces coipomensis]|uniref:U3 snoRNA associated-domain-containing protein n=1 Tax=Scheffersomyces coipomensis TaxID=1788519 RepID=UPI00315D1F7D
MVAITRVTRSQVKSDRKPTKIKFSDEGNSLNDIEYHTAEEEVADVDEEEDDEDEDDIEEDSEEEDEDSDDEAPEEESTKVSEKQIEAKIKKQKEADALSKKAERERRKQLDLKYKEQQESKRQKIEESKPASSHIEQEELPDFLPEELLETVNNQPIIPNGKHLRIRDFEEIDEKLIRQQLMKDKLQKIKLAGKTSMVKGPVHVKVQSFGSTKNKLVPKSESKILKSRDKWLKRKSLNKK